MILFQIIGLLIISILLVVSFFIVISLLPEQETVEQVLPTTKTSDFKSRKESDVQWYKGLLTDYLFEFYGRYFDFTGKTNRTDYWTTFFVSLIVGLFSYLISERLMILISFISIIPGISLQIRRLRDIGKSPEWILLYFLPIIGPFLLLFWFTKPSNYFSKRPLNIALIDSEQVIEKGISNIENQLEKLKSMLSKKLITEEEYKSMRKKILEDF